MEEDMVAAVCGRNGRRALWLVLGVLTLVGVTAALVAPGVARATVIVIVDQQGPNDETGQKDLTRFTSDDASPAGHLLVSFNHDETGFNGANTGDGCLLFDNDANGNADYVLCVTMSGNPATLQTTREFSCGDAASFKCTNPQTQIMVFASTCTVTQTATDPFPVGASYPNDSTSSCNVTLADFAGSATLLDACSFPSAQPNSDPSDCVKHSTGQPPNAVSVGAFRARRAAHGVALRWSTASEVGNVGFDIVRKVGSKTVRINRSLIRSTSMIRGHTYVYVDRTAPSGRATYWLEAIDRSGVRRLVASAGIG
jgi:hypothetical protein